MASNVQRNQAAQIFSGNEKVHNSHPKSQHGCRSFVVMISLVSFVAGAVIAGLGTAQFFGVTGSTEFFLATGIGGGVALLSIGSLLWLAIANCKNKEEEKKVVPSQVTIVAQRPVEVVSERDRDLLFPLINSNTESISQELQNLVKNDFYNENGQESAKSAFTYVVETRGGSVSFPRGCRIEDVENLNGKLDSSVFQVSTTFGVQNDIPTSSKDTRNTHLYQVASQYNASEASSPFLPRPGNAMIISQNDNTQGPAAQRTNPLMFELVNGLLSNVGFNMLHHVLPSAGEVTERNSFIEHGYLRPSELSLENLTKEFEQNYDKAEYVCYSSKPESWGGASNPVYLMLQAAPAIGYSHLSNEADTSQLEKYAALANFTALFQKGIDLARSKNKPVVVHVTGVGLGFFKNKLENVQWGFEKAALSLQTEMKKAKVKVQLESFQKSEKEINQDENMFRMAQNLKISQKQRIGG